MLFDEYAGTVDIDLTHVRSFLRNWYREDDLVTLVGMPTSGPFRTIHSVVPMKEVLEADEDNFRGLLSFDDIKVNMYIGTNPTTEDNSIDLFKSRGTKKDVRDIYGCFVDLDVVKDGKKEGVFPSKEAIYEFLRSLDMQPTIIVDNGASGGVHAYWRLEDEDVAHAPKDLGAMWWSYIANKSPVRIDRLIDITRMLRLPSGIYWPSNGADKFDTVKVISADGPRYSLHDFMSVVEEPHRVYLAKLEALRVERTHDNIEFWNKRLESLYKSDSEVRQKEFSMFQFNVINTLIESYIEKDVLWSDLLGPYGWTHLKTLDDGEETWARPGKMERSAVVNYVDGEGRVSGAMSLLSSSAETGLSDLKEARVPITKFQVMLRYVYDDDISKMVEDLYSKVVK